jgi:hypothetical protein
VAEVVLVCRRTWVLRAALLFTLLPLGLMLTFEGVVLAAALSPACAILAVLGLAVLAYVVQVFRREASWITRAFDDRIEQSVRGRVVALPFAAVRAIWFWADDSGLGGVYGEIVNAATGTNARPLSTINTRVHIRIVGDAGEIRLSSNDRDVMRAFDTVVRQVNPRLLRESLESVGTSERVFGPLRVGKTSVTIGRQSFPLADIEPCELRRGRLYLKRRGTRFGRGIPMKVIPNVLVVVPLLARLQGRVAGALDEGVADKRRGSFV